MLMVTLYSRDTLGCAILHPDRLLKKILIIPSSFLLHSSLGFDLRGVFFLQFKLPPAAY